MATPQKGSVGMLLFGALRLLGVPAALIWILGALADHTGWTASITDPKWLVAGLLVNQIALCVFAARMQFVLRLFEVRLGWISAIRIHLQSMFYFFALPMTVGLEIARFMKIRKLQPAATAVQMSSALLLDRLLGAGSALVIALLCLPFVEPRITLELPGWPLLAGLAVAGVMSVAALLWPRSRRLLGDAIRQAHGRLLALAGLFVLSMLMHVLFATGVQFTAKGLGLPVSSLDTLFVVAGGMLLVAVPISFAGLGPADLGVVGLFAAMGYTPAVALMAGALPYIARLIGAVEGAVWEFSESGVATVTATRRLLVKRRSI